MKQLLTVNINKKFDNIHDYIVRNLLMVVLSISLPLTYTLSGSEGESKTMSGYGFTTKT